MRRTLSVSMIAIMIATSPAIASWAHPGPSDGELEMFVRAAYTAAVTHAAANANYFAADGDFDPLRDAVAAAMTGQPVVVSEEPSADIDSARTCAQPGTTELRIVPTLFGDGVGLAAASDTRVFAYSYDPHQTAEIVVMPAEPCGRR